MINNQSWHVATGLKQLTLLTHWFDSHKTLQIIVSRIIETSAVPPHISIFTDLQLVFYCSQAVLVSTHLTPSVVIPPKPPSILNMCHHFAFIIVTDVIWFAVLVIVGTIGFEFIILCLFY